MQQFDLFTKEDADDATLMDTRSSSIKGRRRKLLPDVSHFFDGELYYVPQWLDQPLASKLFFVLERKLAWKQKQVQVYGKWHTSPRLQAWYGSSEAKYQYSGVNMEPLPWQSELLQLKEACENFCSRESGSRYNEIIHFNSVLANLYRSGEDSMGLHSDDEKELGSEPVIASVTLGGERYFDFVHKYQPFKLRLSLKSGSLLVMKGETQRNWLHCVPKTKKIVAPRINLTFRFIRNTKSG